MRPADDVLAARERLILAHVAAENDRDVEAVMATFTRPRYEIVPSGAVFDGDRAVRGMLATQWRDLPELRYEAVGLFHGEHGLVVETRTVRPGTGHSMLSVNLFGFENLDLVLERCYFDRALFAEFLGAGAGDHG